MKVVPDYYKEFQCIGSKCKDNCCIGWDVYVDEDSVKTYQSVQGSFGRKLKKHLVLIQEPHMKMKDNGRCPFLNDENLCEIYIQLGEESLCDICTRHPRFLDEFENVTEIGLGLSCEVAAKLILQNKKKVKFIKSDIEEIPEELKQWISWRDELLQMMQDTTKDILTRWNTVLERARCLQDELNGYQMIEEMYEVRDWFQEVGTILSQWDYMTDELPNRMRSKEPKLCETKEDMLWEQLSVYFLYRYVLKGYFDDNILEKVKIGLVSFLCIYYWGSGYEEGTIAFAKLYSKEIEYSEDNMDLLKEEILFGGCFSDNALKNVIVASQNL